MPEMEAAKTRILLELFKDTYLFYTASNNTVIMNEELEIGCGLFEGTITPT